MNKRRENISIIPAYIVGEGAQKTTLTKDYSAFVDEIFFFRIRHITRD